MRKTLLTLALTASSFAATACGAQSAPADRADAAATSAANRAALQTTIAGQAQAAPAPAPRGPGPRHAGRMRGGPMMQADTDRDGVLTRAEVVAQAEAQFARLDADGDGIVTAAERQAAREAMRDRREARMAARGKTLPPEPAGMADGKKDQMMRGRRGGGDGVLTQAEFIDRAGQRFDRMDANRDGRLDAGERPDRRAMRHGRGHRMDRPGGDTDQ
ncbi:EF hand domain-containing protein [Sphingomonas aerolata]|uniref:EF hand domain-containing protein n=1 Tax=Sphingomonas aerolata TaxID=185951 RepID=A0A2T4YSW3_9SPHN|nr:hypothetical protein [Sphingomonas aerolata]PTM46907.1 EF hand domain-containing protein [Sphingomonas aerolata]